MALLINLSPRVHYDVTIELGGQAAGDPNSTLTSRLDFMLSAPSLASRTVLLNGVPLHASADGSLPTLEGEPHAGRRERRTPTPTLTLTPTLAPTLTQASRTLAVGYGSHRSRLGSLSSQRRGMRSAQRRSRAPRCAVRTAPTLPNLAATSAAASHNLGRATRGGPPAMPRAEHSYSHSILIPLFALAQRLANCRRGA